MPPVRGVNGEIDENKLNRMKSFIHIRGRRPIVGWMHEGSGTVRYSAENGNLGAERDIPRTVGPINLSFPIQKPV